MGRVGAGFSLLEFVIALTIIGVLIAMAIERIVPLSADAEVAGVEHIVGVMQSAATIRFAAYMAEGRPQAVQAMAGSNPMDYLTDRPWNYVGEMMPEAGQWYWDRQAQALVYRVSNKDVLRGGLKDPVRIRFRIALVYGEHGRAIEGVRVKAMEPFHWVK